MTPKTAIKVLQRKTKRSQSELGILTGLGSNTSISKYISSDMRMSVFQKIISCMGYEIVIRPNGSLDLDEYIKIDSEI